MNPEAQLAYEARVRNRQTTIAALAGILLVGASALQLAGPHTNVDELTLDLIVLHQRFPLDLIAAIVNALAFGALGWTLAYLYRCAAARDAQGGRGWMPIVAIAGTGLVAITGVVYAVLVAINVHTFVTTGSQTYAEAHRLTSSPILLLIQLLGFLGVFLVALGIVMISLLAMRQGLLSRFMGYLGMFAGALVIFQIVQIPVVQGYWLAALAYLFSGRWPTGVPPAWRTGQAEPWPSSAEMRTRRAAGSGGGGGGGRGGGFTGGGGGLFGGFAKPKPAAEPQAAGAPAEPTGVSPPARTRSTTPKRKRKRRN